eukprot:99920_1
MEIFTLKYKDVDNDLIIIDTKKDLRRAYDCASVAKRCLKVFVFNIPNTRISIIRSNHTEEEVDPKSVIQSQVNTQNELEHAQQYDTKAIEDNQAQGIFDSYECNSDKTMTYNYKGCLTIVLCVLCVVIGLSCMIQPEDKTNWRGITREEETEMNDKMQQIDVLEGRAYHTKTKETLHPLKVSREDKEHQNSNKRTVEGEQIPLPTKSVEDDSSTSDSGDDNDTSVDATEDFIDNIDSQDDVVCADVDSFEATDQESPGSIKATHSHDEDNDNDNESQVEYDNTNENATQNNDESQDTNSQESTGDGVTSDMTASEEKEMKPAVQFKLKDRMAQSEGRWDVWSYNTWTGSLLYHPFNPMPYCMMSCQALNRSLECGTQTTHKNCRLNRVENQERSGIGWIMNGTDWESKNKTIRERLLGNKDEMNQSDIQCYGTLTKQICVKNYVPLQTLKRSLVHQSLIPISPLQSINDDREEEGDHRKHGDIDLNVMVYDTTRIIMCEDREIHKERWRNINQEMNQENIKKEEMMKVTIHCGLSTESKHKMYQTEMRCDSLYSVKGMGWESKMKTIKEILLGNKDEMNQSDIQCYGTLTKQICVKNYVPLQTLKRSLVHQSLIPISPLQSINDDSEKERYHRKHGDIDLNVM